MWFPAARGDRPTPSPPPATWSSTRPSSLTAACTPRLPKPAPPSGCRWTDPSLPTYTAKFTVWGNFNTNGQTVNGTFTFNVHGTLLDGSTFSNHVNDHFNVRPDGTVNEFFHCHD
jgi:hypothetical protein